MDNKKIKIIHLIDHLGAGGAQIIIDYLLKNLNNNFKQEVIYFFNQKKYENEFKELGIKVKCLNLGNYNYLKIIMGLINPLNYIKLLMIIKKNKNCILHIHLFYSLIIGSLVGKILNKKIIYTMHAMKNQVPKFFYILKIFSPLINKFVADIDGVADELKLVTNYKKILTINIPTNFYNLENKKTNDFKQKYNIKKNELIILNIGRLHKQKGHKYLIKAFKKVKEKITNIKLIIVGNGEEQDNIEKLIKEYELENDIILPGFQKNILSFYDNCDIYVIPSINEGLGLASIEAMARSKPIIAFNAGALPDIIINGKTGYLVPKKNINLMANEIINLLKNKDKRIILGENACEVIKKEYSLNSFLEKYNNLYLHIYDKE